MLVVTSLRLLGIALVFWCNFANLEYTFNEFVGMVKSNISAARNYILPEDNLKLTKVEDDNEILDFGVFDFIIVGGGSAGTLLANRLSEIKEWNILLLEAGGDENDFSSIPGMAPYLQQSDMNWGYFSTPQTTCCLGMKDKRCVAARGKVLGGSSVLNAKAYVRGNKKDFDNWATQGNDGWAYEDVLSYFIKTENCTIYNADDGFHGNNGLLHVQYNEPTIFTEAFLKSMEEMNVPIVDYNGRNQIGASPIAFTINGIKIASGRRAFIDPIRNSRKNLNISLNSFVTKVLFNNNKQAMGVEFIKYSKKYRVAFSKEIILSAGVFNSPQILLLSGVGPKTELDKHFIKVIHELPVGKYLQDHASFFGFNVRTNHTCYNDSLEDTLKNYLQGHRPLTNPMNTDSYRFLRTSLKSTLVDDFPDIQHILNVPPGFEDQFGSSINFNANITKSLQKNYNPYSDLNIAILLLHPKSFGSITLKSSNAKDFPNIDYRLFSDAENRDIETIYEGIMEAFKILDTKPFKALNATFIPIETDCGNFSQFSKVYWYCLIRHMSSVLYHPVGTTKMGTSPEDSVVTPRLEVHGIKKLRIIDAGVIPSSISGNINAVVYMIAEKGADMIKKEYNVC